ncbi:uncharacterized protein LOC129808435 [Phlebotomus papatasi]|uniref:uncharacterized protein LOC129808435 n=1 Tax=Phlebotomus papatasi TaxID=29031 RepID=UPI00248440C4|nr:uncharacterized protein LOC129808435 [Phlebotomus papatasi]
MTTVMQNTGSTPAINHEGVEGSSECNVTNDKVIEEQLKNNVTHMATDNGENEAIVQIGEGKEDSASSEDRASLKILDKSRKYNHFFKMTQMVINFKLNRPTNITTEDWIQRGFDGLIEEIRKESMSDADKVILRIFVTDEPTEKAIYIGMRPLNTLTADIILEYMEKIHQSTEMFHSSEILQVRAFLLHPHEGRGRNYNPAGMDMEDIRHFKKKSMIDIDIGESCLPIALLIEDFQDEDEEDRR